MTTEMTIEQAIKYTSKLKKKISDARMRATTSLNHKSDEKTAFDFQEMLTSADVLSYQLAEVQGKLAVKNATNTVKYMDRDITLSHAVRILQELKGRIAWLDGLPSLNTDSVASTERAWDEVSEKYITTPVVTKCNLPAAKKAAMMDALQDEFDLLNGAVNLVNQVVKLTI